MNRWIRLSAAMVAMIMIGNLQYAWTLFVQPMIAGTHWKLSEVQWGYSIFIAMMTWAMPVAGRFIDKLGPRMFMSVAGILCMVGWGSLGHTRTLPEFYLLYAIAGLGNSFVYCCSTALGLKWFPDKRGIASGLIAAAYGSGAAFFNPIFGYLIKKDGYQFTLLSSGIVLGTLILIAGQFLKYPPAGFVSAAGSPPKPRVRRQEEQFTSWEMLKTPQFYMLYAMMLMVSIGGLMATAQVAPIARNFKIGALALTLALSLNPLGNGVARFSWGWVSDYLGRERTMALAFFLQALCLASVVTVGRLGDVWFVATVVLVFLTWGELYVLFPTMCADMFGAQNAASNYGFLYSTKGVAAILGGGIAAKVFEMTGTWDYVFYGSAVLALIAACAAVGLRRIPLPRKHPAPEVAPFLAQAEGSGSE